MIVLVPAYEPDHRLPDLVRDLAGVDGVRVVVVDDGSGLEHAAVFADAAGAGAEVLAHAENRGKGAALRTGFAHVAVHHPGEAVVCADSDGQHTLLDILRVAAALDDDADMVLGVRRFTGTVPLRSRLGNRVAAGLFRLVTGTPVTDTQTGLRGYPHRMLGWLARVPGERFEYEQNLLLRASRDGLAIREVEIATVYLESNRSSHFRPLWDSARVLRPLLAFAAASLAGFAVDSLLLFALYPLLGSLAAAVVLARLASAAVNFLANRHLVFGAGADPLWPAVRRYALLAAGVLVANLTLMELLTPVTGVVAAKLATEGMLFAAGYLVQSRLVFVRPVSARTQGPASAGSTSAGAAVPVPATPAPTPRRSPSRDAGGTPAARSRGRGPR